MYFTHGARVILFIHALSSKHIAHCVQHVRFNPSKKGREAACNGAGNGIKQFLNGRGFPAIVRYGKLQSFVTNNHVSLVQVIVAVPCRFVNLTCTVTPDENNIVFSNTFHGDNDKIVSYLFDYF